MKRASAVRWATCPEMPTGGCTSSSLGRTGGSEGLNEFTVLERVHVTVHATAVSLVTPG